MCDLLSIEFLGEGWSLMCFLGFRILVESFHNDQYDE